MSTNLWGELASSSGCVRGARSSFECSEKSALCSRDCWYVCVKERQNHGNFIILCKATRNVRAEKPLLLIHLQSAFLRLSLTLMLFNARDLEAGIRRRLGAWGWAAGWICFCARWHCRRSAGVEGAGGGLNCGCSRVFYYIKYYVSPDSQFYVLFRV